MSVPRVLLLLTLCATCVSYTLDCLLACLQSEEEDSDTERKRLRREKRAAKKAAAAAPASQPVEEAPVAEPVVQEQPVRPATAMLPSIPDELWPGLTSSMYDSAQEYEYDGEVREVPVASIPITSHVLDVGSDTREAWTERAGVLARAGVTVILYGPLGVVETPDGAGSTREFLDGLVALKSSSASKVAVIAAGGSLSVWATAFGHAASLDCVCNGGAGLSLLLAGATVPGVAVLSDGK